MRDTAKIDGLDTPEKDQPFGQRSKPSASDLACDRTALAQSHKVDRYVREVFTVLVTAPTLVWSG